MTDFKVVAWDFDGVLNRNIVAGRFVWQDTFEADLGHAPQGFQTAVFGNGYEAVMTGREDLATRVQAWADLVGFAPGAEALIAYWFAKDARPDPMTVALMDRLAARGIRQVIATNNEARRARYIADDMGFAGRVEQIFASGHLGVIKPDPAFFQTVTDTLGVAPGEMLLIDDLARNVDAARALGWQAFHFTDDTRDDLPGRLGLLAI